MLHCGAFEQALTHEDEGLLERIYENRQCAGFRSSFDAIELVYGGEIEGVGGESVKSVGGDGDDTSAHEEMRRVSQCIDFRCLRINAQKFCRQFFGPRRSRTLTPQRSAALPLFGRRYHGWIGGSNGEGALQRQGAVKSRFTARKTRGGAEYLATLGMTVAARFAVVGRRARRAREEKHRNGLEGGDLLGSLLWLHL